MDLIQPDTSPIQPRFHFGALWRMVRAFIVVSTIVGLAILNVLTLVSESVHELAFNALGAVAGAVLSNALLSRVLANAPTIKKRAAVASATKALAHELSTVSESNRVLARKNASLEKDVLDGKTKHAGMERSHKAVEAKNTELTRKAAKQAAAARAVSKRVAARSVVGAARSLSTLPGRVIPVAGATLVVGITAWDIHDLCETVRDVNELNVAFDHEQEDQTKVCGMKVPTREQALAQVRENWRGAYQVAAESLNRAGSAMVPSTPPEFSWTDVKGAVCPLLGSSLAACY